MRFWASAAWVAIERVLHAGICVSGSFCILEGSTGVDILSNCN